MALPYSRKWMAVALLAIIIPVSLLTTFKIAGIVREPLVPEIVNVGAVVWNVTRPESFTYINGVVENHYDDGLSKVNMCAFVIDYSEKSEVFGEHIWLTINATAQTQEGFINSMLIKLSVCDADNFLSIHLLSPWPKTQNLKTDKMVTLGTENQDAYVYATEIGNPTNCYFEIIASWHFLDKRALDHWTTATLETTYFNGTAYRKVITPVKIGVLI